MQKNCNTSYHEEKPEEFIQTKKSKKGRKKIVFKRNCCNPYNYANDQVNWDTVAARVTISQQKLDGAEKKGSQM